MLSLYTQMEDVAKPVTAIRRRKGKLWSCRLSKNSTLLFGGDHDCPLERDMMFARTIKEFEVLSRDRGEQQNSL